MSSVENLRPEPLAKVSASKRAPALGGNYSRQRQISPFARFHTDYVGRGGGGELARLGDVGRIYGAPWTRDGTVRVYVVTMAPRWRDASSRCRWRTTSWCTRAIRCSKSIRPTIASHSSRRRPWRSVMSATLDYARKNEKRKAMLAKDGWTSTDIYQQTTSSVGQSEGVVALDNAAIDKARARSQPDRHSLAGQRIRDQFAGPARRLRDGRVKRSSQSSTPIPFGLTGISRRPLLARSMRATRRPSS